MVRIFPAFSRKSECGKMREKCGPEELGIRNVKFSKNLTFLDAHMNGSLMTYNKYEPPLLTLKKNEEIVKCYPPEIQTRQE